MVSIQTTVDAQGLIATLDIIVQGKAGIKDALNDAGKVLITSINKNFDAQGRPRWTPFAASTLYKKAHRKSAPTTSPKLLQDTGLLRNSIVAKMVNDTTLEVGPSRTYGVFHQLGTRTIPARPFNIAQEEDVTRIAGIFERMMTRGKGSFAQ
jgi:phage virion morphogenesis protein